MLASADSSFTTTTSLGAFDANPNNDPRSATLPEVFTFAPTSAAFVRMVITSNNGNIVGTGFGEAAFEVQAIAIPEPSTLAMRGTAVLLGLGAWSRRRRQIA